MDRVLRLLVSIKESKWGDHGAGTDDDGLVERLSRRYTSTLLASFAMMVTTKQFVGEPISCWCPTYFTDGQRQYTNNVCWISNTFYVPLPVRIVRSSQCSSYNEAKQEATYRRPPAGGSGVATGWTGVDMSTPLLREVIPEIDANPMTFLGASGGGGGKCKRVGEVIRQSEQLLNF